MVSEEIRRFIAGISLAIVATADSGGQPHVALGRDPRMEGDKLLVFENWFCQTTLRNVAQNPRVALALMGADGTGYQLLGTVAGSTEAAILDGYVPDRETPGEPQVLTRFAVRIEDVLAFCSGIHTDLSLVTRTVAGEFQ